MPSKSNLSQYRDAGATQVLLTKVVAKPANSTGEEKVQFNTYVPKSVAGWARSSV